MCAIGAPFYLAITTPLAYICSMIFMRRQYPIVIAETLPFQRACKKLMSDEELSGLIGHVAFHPEGGDVIQNTHGVRKLRWDRPGMGKSGGLRVLYFYHDLNMPLYLLNVYAKSNVENISEADKKIIRKYVKVLVDTHFNRIGAKNGGLGND